MIPVLAIEYFSGGAYEKNCPQVIYKDNMCKRTHGKIRNPGCLWGRQGEEIMLLDLFLKNRSYRRFYQDHEISRNHLQDLIELARLSPSAANMQPLKFILSHTPEKNNRIFPSLAWAAYIKEWSGPAEGERPSAYIVILGDSEISKNIRWDHSIVAQSMLLGAVEMGLGGCIIGAVNRDSLREALRIPERYEIMLVLALGKPKEKVRIEPVGPDGDIKYWRDSEGVHYVPKRSRDELIIDL
jgi:nitroreductase